jgi:parallel beta-helix repeat protein
MDGRIKKLISEEGTVAFPVTIAESVFLNKEQNLAEKFYAERYGWGTYVIDIEHWGIQKGIPSKPYQEEDYHIAYRNIQGINRALKYARTKNYSLVVMPRGEYSLCYPLPIDLVDNITFNLNGSVFKVIYDSDTKSPYDDRTSGAVYLFAGVSFRFHQVKNAHLTNGKIIGDMYDRSFTDSNERWVEHTYGVSFTYGASYCSLSHCDVSGYAGDNVNFTSVGWVRGSIPGTPVLGDINEKGEYLPSSNTIITDYVPVPDGEYSVVSLSGQGYSRQTSLNNKEFNVAFFSEENEFIGRTTNMRVLFPVTIPRGAKKIKFIFRDEMDPGRNLNIFTNFGGMPAHNVVEFNEIYNGHRGGITMGGSYCTIRNNRIRDNGKAGTTFLDGIPSFPDSTKYAINQEDSYGDNSIIKDNLITGGFHGILTRGYSVFIENNVITNMSGSGIVVYDQEFTTIRGNYMRRAGVYLFGAGGQKNAFVNITDNYIEGSFNVEHPGYNTVVTGNFFKNSILSLGKALYKNNIVKLVAGGAFVNSENKISDCLFFADQNDQVQPEIHVRNGFEKCQFKNVLVTLNINNPNKIELKECEFVDCRFRTYQHYHTVLFNKCTFKDSLVQSTCINNEKRKNDMTFKECSFESVNIPYFFQAMSNITEGIIVRFYDCYFLINNNEIEALFDNNYITDSIIAYIIGNVIENRGINRLTIPYFKSDKEVWEAYISKNKLVNILLTYPNQVRYKLYDPVTHSLEVPSSGIFSTGEIIYNGMPDTGENIGWICVKSGQANSTGWMASKAYELNDIVNASGFVYRCVEAGTSGTVKPSHPEGIANDGTVRWEYLNRLAVFKQFGVIQD